MRLLATPSESDARTRTLAAHKYSFCAALFVCGRNMNIARVYEAQQRRVRGIARKESWRAESAGEFASTATGSSDEAQSNMILWTGTSGRMLEALAAPGRAGGRLFG